MGVERRVTLTVLMPSRGRERQAQEAHQAFLDTKAREDTQFLAVLDADQLAYSGVPFVYVEHAGGMANALNAALDAVDSDVIGFIGDDHRFRTPSWDETISVANGEIGGGIVYGNDLLKGEELPSQVFIDTRIVRALGWMALPGAKHLFLDD